jgi:hypothetical protein
VIVLDWSIVEPRYNRPLRRDEIVRIGGNPRSRDAILKRCRQRFADNAQGDAYPERTEAMIVQSSLQPRLSEIIGVHLDPAIITAAFVLNMALWNRRKGSYRSSTYKRGFVARADSLYEPWIGDGNGRWATGAVPFHVGKVGELAFALLWERIQGEWIPPDYTVMETGDRGDFRIDRMSTPSVDVKTQRYLYYELIVRCEDENGRAVDHESIDLFLFVAWSPIATTVYFLGGISRTRAFRVGTINPGLGAGSRHKNLVVPWRDLLPLPTVIQRTTAGPWITTGLECPAWRRLKGNA